MNRFEKILGKYEVLNALPLGTGAHSTIYAVKDKNNHVYALKHVIRNSPEEQRFIEQAVLEHQVAIKIDHPAIRKAAAWLLVPYMVWLSFAAILNFQIDQRNPDAETLVPAAASTQIG